MTKKAVTPDRSAGPAREPERASGRRLYRPLTGFVVRAPLLPADCYRQFGAGDDGELRAWADPAVRFAVSVASADLTASLSGPGGAGKSSARARSALQRYLIRACLRPTPYGGFAAVAVGHWADRTDLAIAPVARPTRTRPDMGWLTAIAKRLADDPAYRTRLRVFANTCAFERNGRIYLTDPAVGGVGTAPDLSVRATPVVRRVLARARAGAEIEELRQDLLASSASATRAKADRLLAELYEHQLLVPELLPALTADPLGHVIAQLARLPDAAGRATRLSDIRAACAELDEADPAAAGAALPAIRRQMRDLAASLQVGQPAGRSDELQVDSALPLLGRGVSRRIADDVTGAVSALIRLHPAPRADRLAGYRAAFHRRYGDHRRVPLLELLDPRFGLGPPASSEPGRHLPPSPDGDVAAWRRGPVVQELFATSIRDGCTEVVLDPGLVERLSTWVPDPERLAPSAELSVFVAACSPAAVDRGDYLLVIGPNLGAEAAGRSLGRFADLLGAPARALLQEAADAENAGPGVAAELVYRPVRARSANVAVRPLVRSYEIPVGVAPSLPPDAVIKLDELSVLLREGRLRLWWERAGCEVNLTAGHMLNPAAAPPLCQQLIELASDGVTHLTAFDWGPVSRMPFLPRVRIGRVVLHPAQWRLTPPGGGASAAADPARFAGWLADWRIRWRMPRHAYLTQADNRLLLDLDDAGHREQLRRAMTRPGQAAAVLQEGLPGPEHAWLPGPGGPHVVEVVVPVVRDRHEGRPPQAPRREHVPERPAPAGNRGFPVIPQWPDRDRLRPPESDWLYVSLFGPRSSEDGLLAGSLGALADQLVDRGDADGWFFVRYGDPEPQLRLRLHGQGAALTGQALPALARWAARAIAGGVRTRLTLETYERELERYGGPVTTGVCERIACVDSQNVRRLLATTSIGGLPSRPGGPAPEGTGEGSNTDRADCPAPPAGLDRVELAMVSTAHLLASLLPDPAEQARVCRNAAGAAMPSGAVFRERTAHFRGLVAALDSASASHRGTPEHPFGRQWPSVRDALTDRRASLAPLAEQLEAQCLDGTALRPLADLVPSILHMHANRLGLDPAQERLMLGLLDRTMRSVRAYPGGAAP